MTSSDTPKLVFADWAKDSAAIRAVRNEVFSVEQGISAALDFDGRDQECVHVLARLGDSTPVGTARMLPDGHVGRIAVTKPWRGRGVGSSLVEYLCEAAGERGLDQVFLHSQVQAAGFYTGLDFEVRGDAFMEAGIEHVLMVRNL